MTPLPLTLRVWRFGASALVAGLLTAGCELADTVAPTLESRVVVHAVLNPLSTQQIVLVEFDTQPRKREVVIQLVGE